ncbi:hypothetical protein HMPREF9624_00922 [Oribacterium asaccharolyticum ACB7]|uniref:G5 domain-containing protein n=1 Tax=Oribacterium asaccharolyticum ACB7 TaxID=796944 RepID=G9WVI8_9FIRM|nr:hypothetical protein [Oribacterium asaccharolyticum]EHL11589.1 hypothetical protein HMPREF9624_00922 [Oribacterium asaccharolyticum ACB7]
MRKSIKTALAFLLAVSCICSTVVSAATLAGETALSEGIDRNFPKGESTASSEKEFAEKETGESSKEEEDLQKKLLQEAEPTEGSESIQEAEPAEEAESTEEAETTQEDEASEEAFYAEKELSGVLITVQADSGVFPKGATLRVRKLSKVEEQKVDSTVKEKLEEDKQNLLQSIIFDISVLDQNGEEIQPDTAKGEVKVSFSKLPFLEENAEKQISVFHLDSVDAAAEKLETEKIEEKENAVEVSAEHFSLFAVSLVKKENTFSDTVAVELGDTISLYKLLRRDVLRCEAMKETDPAAVRLKHDGDGQVAIEALHEGTARLLITIKDDLGEKKKNTGLSYRKHLLVEEQGRRLNIV